MNDGTALLAPLAREPERPSTVDLQRAMADGDRRVRMHRVLTGVAGTTVLALVVAGGLIALRPARGPERLDPALPSPTALSPTVPSPEPKGPAVPTSCTGQLLPLPPGPTKSIVSGGDPTGRYIVGRQYPGGTGTQKVLIWDNRQPRIVPIPGQDQLLNDVNTAGVAVGTSFLGDLTAAWVYRDGTVTRLHGGVAEANGINDSGVIVGAVGEQPARWRSSSDEPEKLALPEPGWTGYAAGIDEDGTIVGRLTKGSAEIGYLWSPDGTGRQLPVPQLRGKPATVYTADAIRYGWVQGWVALDEGPIRYTGAVRWNLRTGEVDSDTFQGHAESVNRHGWMVGSLYPQGAGFIADGTVVELPRPDGVTPPTGQGTTGTIPYTISDDGRTLAGQSDLAEIQPAAVVWTCR